VSSAEKAAEIITELENYDLRILNSIEIGMIQHEMVPFEEILKFSRLNESELEWRLKKLNELELIYRQSEPYLGYMMNYIAYDLLALNALVKSNILEALGPSIGLGKEADVYQAITPENQVVAIKFHRLGRTSFRDTRRKREYIADRKHMSWLYQSRLAAENEYEALEIVHKGGVASPEPFAQNRHCIVMQIIEGIQLSEVIELDYPREYLMDILKNVRKAVKVGIIHTDLSEFNILVTEEGEIWLIDWPQYIMLDHPNSIEMLERDIRNIVYFFQRKHMVDITLEFALNMVKKGTILESS
jgi:RIO kinase 2